MVENGVLKGIPEFLSGTTDSTLETSITVNLSSFSEPDLGESIQPFLAWLKHSGCAAFEVQFLVSEADSAVNIGTPKSKQLKRVLGMTMTHNDPVPSVEMLLPLLFRPPLSWRDWYPPFQKGV